MTVQKEAWVKMTSKETVVRYLSDPIPFQDLPSHYQDSILDFIHDGIPEEKRESHLARYRFRFGDVPTNALTDEIQRVQQSRPEGGGDKWDSFAEYHKWYTQYEMPDHGPENRWPVTLSPYYEEEVLDDGWHRLHDYYRKGHSTIPVVDWVKVK